MLALERLLSRLIMVVIWWKLSLRMGGGLGLVRWCRRFRCMFLFYLTFCCFRYIHLTNLTTETASTTSNFTPHSPPSDKQPSQKATLTKAQRSTSSFAKHYQAGSLLHMTAVTPALSLRSQITMELSQQARLAPGALDLGTTINLLIRRIANISCRDSSMMLTRMWILMPMPPMIG